MAKKTKSFEELMIEQFGEKVLNNHTKEVEVISTGSLSLDASIGVGGIPKGMITELYGSEGSGKTTVALNTAKSVVANGGKVLYIDVENLLNPSMLTTILGDGIATENITILTPDSAEDAFMMAEAGIDSNQFELIVIDSVGAMASRKEKEVDFDKDTMMVLPKLIGKFIKRNSYNIRVNNIAVLVLNQVRDNVGSYVKSLSSPGGHILKHQAALRIALSKGQDLKRGNDTVGIMVKFVIKKNKLAAPFKTYMIPLIFGEGIDYLSDLIEFGKVVGVLESNGPYYKFNGENLGQGKVAVRENLLANQELLEQVKQAVYAVVGKQSTLPELLDSLEEEEEE